MRFRLVRAARNLSSFGLAFTRELRFRSAVELWDIDTGAVALPKEESDGSGESTNCHLLKPDEVDWHIYLSDTAALDDISQAVIVETTPRTRPLHKWKKSDLDSVVNKNVPVRVSGWLLYDFEHVNAIGTQRASVWEVHPITKIEIQRNGQWVDLDQ